jgi:hypothetical protein
MINRIIYVGFFFGVSIGMGAPCCGSTANIPNLLTGDDQSQLTSTMTYSRVTAEVSPQGVFKERASFDREITQSLRLDGATLLSDRLQLGFTVPTIRRSRERKENQVEAMGLGDLSFQLAYELIPEWNYSDWRPKGFLFAGGVFPTGGSTYDSQLLYGIDSRGRGFYAASLGSLWLKTISNFDASLLLEAHRYFSKTRQTTLGDLVLNPGWGFTQSMSLGFSPGGAAFRLGVLLSHSTEDAVETSGVFEGKGEPITLWTMGLQLGYLASTDLSFSVNVSDQSLFGDSANTPLSQTVGFIMQKRWER